MTVRTAPRATGPADRRDSPTEAALRGLVARAGAGRRVVVLAISVTNASELAITRGRYAVDAVVRALADRVHASGVDAEPIEALGVRADRSPDRGAPRSRRQPPTGSPARSAAWSTYVASGCGRPSRSRPGTAPPVSPRRPRCARSAPRWLRRCAPHRVRCSGRLIATRTTPRTGWRSCVTSPSRSTTTPTRSPSPTSRSATCTRTTRSARRHWCAGPTRCSGPCPRRRWSTWPRTTAWSAGSAGWSSTARSRRPRPPAPSWLPASGSMSTSRRTSCARPGTSTWSWARSTGTGCHPRRCCWR